MALCSRIRSRDPDTGRWSWEITSATFFRMLQIYSDPNHLQSAFSWNDLLLMKIMARRAIVIAHCRFGLSPRQIWRLFQDY
jgi:hypothetical protein